MLNWSEPNSPQWLSLEDLPDERWKDIEGFEGLYQISDYGRVKSLEKIIVFKNKNGTEREVKYCTKMLKRNIIPTAGYLFVNLYNNKLKIPKTIHRLVAQAFIENVNDLPIVMHKDDDKIHNHYTNLQWGTHSENIQSAYDNKLHPNIRSVVQLSKFGDVINIYDTISAAAKDNNILVTSIANCLAKRSMTAGGYVWKYIERGEYEEYEYY